VVHTYILFLLVSIFLKMVQKPTEIGDVFFVIFKIWKYTFLPIYDLKDSKSNRFVYFKSKSYYIGLAIFLVLTIIYIKEINKSERLQTTVDLFEISFLFINDVLLILFTHNKSQQILSLTTKLAAVEKLLKELKDNHHSYHRRFRNFALKTLATKYILSILTCTLDCLDVPDYSFYNISYYLAWSFHFNIEIVIILILLLLQQYYQDLSKYLKIQKCQRKLRVDVERIVAIFTHLRKIFNALKRTFQLQILLMLTTNFVITVTGAFYTLYTEFKNESSVFENFLIVCCPFIIWIVLMCISNFTVMYFFGVVLELVTRQQR
jgi:hypothetical protein